MTYKLIFGLAAVVASLAQFLPYIRDILRGKTHPHAFSWFVWGLPCGIIFAAQVVEGAIAGSWATGATAILCTIIFLLALFYGETEIKVIDWICFVMGLFALALWFVTKNPLSSVVLITLADVLGFLPTLRKSIFKPYDETLSAYAIGGLKWILSLLALENYSFIVYLYPVAMIFANWLLVGVLWLRRSSVPKAVGD